MFIYFILEMKQVLQTKLANFLYIKNKKLFFGNNQIPEFAGIVVHNPLSRLVSSYFFFISFCLQQFQILR
jgi:hypothetical protein